MSSIRDKMLGRFAGLESDVPANGGATGLQVGEVVDEAGAQIDGENLPEAEIISAADDTEVIEEGADEVDTLIESSESLESFLAAAQLANKQGGWTAPEAAAYNMGIDVAISRIGLRAKEIMPAVESFGTSGRERINATASVEGRIQEILKEIWEAIKKAVNKVVVFVRQWCTKVFDGASRLKKRAEAISKKAQGNNGSKKESKIRTGVIGALHDGTKDINVATVTGTITLVTDLVAGMTKGKLATSYASAADALATALDGAVEANGASPVETAVAAAETAASSLAGAISSAGLKHNVNVADKYPTLGDVASKVEAKQSDVLAGGKKISVLDLDVASGKSGVEKAKAAAKVAGYNGQLSVVDASNTKVEIDESKEVKVLEMGEITQIADQVIKFCDVVIDYKQGFESYERKSKEVMKKVDTLKNKTIKGEDASDLTAADKGVIIRELANGVGSKIKNQGQAVTSLINYGLGVSRAALVYANSSLNQYKA